MCLRSFNMMISFVVIEFVLLEDLFITNLVIYQYIPFFFLFSIPKITPINGKNPLFMLSPLNYRRKGEFKKNNIEEDIFSIYRRLEDLFLHLKKNFLFQFVDKVTLTTYNAPRSVISAAR